MKRDGHQHQHEQPPRQRTDLPQCRQFAKGPDDGQEEVDAEKSDHPPPGQTVDGRYLGQEQSKGGQNEDGRDGVALYTRPVRQPVRRP